MKLEKLYINRINATITLDEETHIYHCDKIDYYSTIYTQISGTSIIGKFQKFSFEEPKWSMYSALVKKRMPDKLDSVNYSIWAMRKAYELHMDWRKGRGTALHLKAENGELEKIENLIEKLNWDPENNIIIREFKMYAVFTGEYKTIHLPGTIDLAIINPKTKEIILVDYKFSNANKKPYLDKQLNLYMSLLKTAGFVCRSLKGITIKDNETMTIHAIEDKNYDIEAIVTTIDYFET